MKNSEKNKKIADPAPCGFGLPGMGDASMDQCRFRTVIDELHTAVFEWDLKTGAFFSSDEYRKYAMSRVSNEDILGNRGPLDTVHPDDAGKLADFFRETKAGSAKAETVLRLKLTDGSYRWCRMLGLYQKDADGMPTRTIGVIIDINEERERSFMLNQLLDEMPGGVGIFTFREGLKCQYFNDGFVALSGRTRAEIARLLASGVLLETLIAPVDYKMVSDAVRACADTGRQIHLNYRYIYQDGSVRWLHLSAVKMREENGCPVYYCVFTAPSEETALYRGMVEESAVGVYVADRRTRRTIYANAAARDMVGVSRKVKNRGRVITEYLKKAGKSALLTGQDVASLREDRFTEFHFETDAGFIAVRAKALQWNGMDSYILYMMDETREHERQTHLQELVNKVPTGIGIYDLDYGQVKLTYLNDAYYEQLGMTRESRKQFYGTNALEAVYPEDREKIVQVIGKLYAGSQKESVLHRVQNKEGRWIWLNLTASVVERHGEHIRIYAAFSDCDEMMQTQQEMKAARKREQILLSSIPGGIAVYRLKKSGRLTADYVSEGLARICGYSYEEFLPYIREEAFAGTAPEDVPIVRNAARQSLADHKPFSIRYHIHVKNSPDVLIRTDARLVEGERLGEDDVAVWYAVHTIVSDDARLAIAEQNRYRSLMDAMDVAFLEWEKDKGFYASERYEAYALSEQPFERVISNRADKTVVFPDDWSVLAEFFAHCLEKQPKVSATLRLKMKDGSYRWTEMLSFIDYDADGNAMRVVGILRDVDQERIEQNERLRLALEEAQKANRAKTAFLSRVSHDMRTPLNGILGLTNIVREKVRDEETRRDLSELELSGQYLLNLINDTLDVGRIESGKLELHPVVYDGKTMLRNSVELARRSIESKKIEFVVHAEALPFSTLYVDVGRVEQVVMNVLGNAAKFTPEGGRIEVTLTNLSVENGLITDQLVVEDTGIGISPEFLPHVFDAFSQEDASRTSSRQGTGLGMAITKQILQAMGGDITVESELGKGTKFTMILPLQIATEEQVAAWRQSQAPAGDGDALRGKRVLLCEDHPLNAKIAVRLLTKKGMTVEHMENGKAGVERFAASPAGYFQAVLMDIRMPVMDGINAAAAIRSLDRTDAQTVPIIAMTANAFEEDIRETQRAGMNAHLSKPIEPQKLYQTLETVFRGVAASARPLILLVDDIAANRAVLREALAPAYELLEAGSGAEALRLLEENRRIEAVITDIQMPEMDGVELIRRIRKNPEDKRVVIIANTQFGDRNQENELLAIGADEFIYKPTSPDIVKIRVGNALKRLS